MAKQTNKTNHILNLLSGNGKKKEQNDDQELENAVPPVVPKGKEKENKEQLDDGGHVEIETQAVIDVVDEKIEEKENEELVNSINLALEDELKEYEEANGKQATEDESMLFSSELDDDDEFGVLVDHQESVLMGKDDNYTASSEEMPPIVEPVAEPLAEESVENEEQLSSDSNTDNEEPSYTTLNVMEKLVDMFALEYMEKFQICTCDRCVADVKALTLTKLAGKYIVVDKGAEQAMINFYEKKFKSDVVVELTKACMTIDENPHH